MGALKDYQEWKIKSSSIGCKFARMVAMRPDQYGNVAKISIASSSANAVANGIYSIVANAVADADAVALTVLMPEVRTFDLFCSSMIALSSKPGWHCDQLPVVSSDGSDFVGMSMSVRIPRSDGILVPSEVLAFGDFDHFPNTRRAPITAIELYVGDPNLVDPKSGEDKKKANLAHIDLPLLPQEAIKRTWDATMRARLNSLGGVEDGRAKAKISFVVPSGQAAGFGLEQ